MSAPKIVKRRSLNLSICLVSNPFSLPAPTTLISERQPVATDRVDIQAFRMLCADWLSQLGSEAGLRFTQYGSSGESITIGSPTDLHVTAHFIDDDPYLRFVSSDSTRQAQIDSLAEEAASRTRQGNFGSIVWYFAACPAPDFELPSPMSMGSLVERLSNQARIIGWRRLGTNVLIEFAEELPKDWDEKNAILAPKALAHVHIAVPAPCAGNFSAFIAHSVLETAAAICSFALGRAVSLPPTIFPSRPEQIAEIGPRQFDQTILSLARKHVSLDVFSAISVPGGLDHFQRIRSSLLTFDAAKRQEHDAVACSLYVVAAECLTALQTPWRDSKVTKRFIEFFDALMPEELDQIVSHGNFEAVFGMRRGNRTPRALRRDTLEKIYEFRSGNLHAGLRPSYRGFTSGFGTDESVRRALFADFAEGAILRYLGSPRSSLIGHPNCSYTRPNL
jgi:hypothetical protein